MKIGVIGCGNIAQKHMLGYRSIKGVELIVYDVNADFAKKLAEQFDCRWERHLENILGDGAVIAIDICTPTPSHESLVLMAIQAGKHVFFEKPLTDNLESAQRLQQAAATAKLILMGGFLYRFHPAYELVKQVLEEKIIGQPYLAHFRLGGRGSHRLWKHQKAQGGGAINEMLVHMLDLALWYFGKMTIMGATQATVLPQREVQGQLSQVDAEDYVQVQLKSANGVRIVCQADLITPSYMNHVEVMGTEGSLITSILDHLPTVVFCKRPRGIYQQGNNFFNFPKTNLFERELQYFIQCIQDGEQPQINPLEDSLELMRLMEDIRRGAVYDSFK